MKDSDDQWISVVPHRQGRWKRLWTVGGKPVRQTGCQGRCGDQHSLQYVMIDVLGVCDRNMYCSYHATLSVIRVISGIFTLFRHQT